MNYKNSFRSLGNRTLLDSLLRLLCGRIFPRVKSHKNQNQGLTNPSSFGTLVSMEYLDTSLVDGFKIVCQERLGEAIDFALAYQDNQDEGDIDELRQAAQDALSEIVPAFLEGITTAYQRSALKAVDYEAISTLFRQLAIRAKLDEHVSSETPVTLITRKGSYSGVILSVREHEDQEQVELGAPKGESAWTQWVPFASVQSISL
jgi:hypothetical protein